MDGWLDELRMVEEVDGWRMASWTDSWMNEITCMNLIKRNLGNQSSGSEKGQTLNW